MAGVANRVLAGGNLVGFVTVDDTVATPSVGTTYAFKLSGNIITTSVERQDTGAYNMTIEHVEDNKALQDFIIASVNVSGATEELLFEDGRLLSGNLTNYKIPDLMATPEIDAVFLDDADNPHAVLSSKAIGEPPLMYGIGAYFALRNAIRAFNPSAIIPFDAPMTPEKVLLALYQRKTVTAASMKP